MEKFVLFLFLICFDHFLFALFSTCSFSWLNERGLWYYFFYWHFFFPEIFSITRSFLLFWSFLFFRSFSLSSKLCLLFRSFLLSILFQFCLLFLWSFLLSSTLEPLSSPLDLFFSPLKPFSSARSFQSSSILSLFLSLSSRFCLFSFQSFPL